MPIPMRTELMIFEYRGFVIEVYLDESCDVKYRASISDEKQYFRAMCTGRSLEEVKTNAELEADQTIAFQKNYLYVVVDQIEQERCL